MYLYFQRGLMLYWSENPALIKRAHARANEVIGKFPPPSEIKEVDIHPSRLGNSWKLSSHLDVG